MLLFCRWLANTVSVICSGLAVRVLTEQMIMNCYEGLLEFKCLKYL